MSEHELIIAIIDGLAILTTLGMQEETMLLLKNLIHSITAFFNMYLSSDSNDKDKLVYLELIQKFIQEKVSLFSEYPVVQKYLEFINSFIEKNYKIA